MAVSRKIQRWRIFDAESEEGFQQFKDRVYGVPQATTLDDTDVNMQVGDTLPDDSTYEIISANIDMVKPLTTATGNHKGGRAARLRAVKFKTEADAETGYYWEELSGTRIFNDSDPQVVQYQIQFIGLTASAVPAVGSLYIAFPGAGTLTSTNLDREPVAVSISQKKKATVLKSIITVVFQAHHARTATTSPATEINPRRRVRTGRFSWKGTRRFSIPTDLAAGFETSLYGGIFPNMSGKYAPKCVRVETFDEPPQMPGRSLMVAEYETPRVVGEGRLRIILGTTAETVTRDLNNKLMVGAEPYKRGSTTYWGERRLISGSNTRLKAMSTIILETAATEYQLNLFMNKVGHVNKYTLPKFGKAQPGTLLFLGQPQTTYALVGDLWYINLAFKYSGDPSKVVDGKKFFPKWNEMTESQLGTHQVIQLDATTAAGTVITGKKREVLQWIPFVFNTAGKLTEDGPTTVHKNFPIADFTDLGKELIITGL